MIDDCTRHIVDLFPSSPQPSEQVLLLAAHRRVAGTSQFRIEHPVTFDGRAPDTHIPAAGIGVFRKGNDLFPVIECSGDRPFGITAEPCRYRKFVQRCDHAAAGRCGRIHPEKVVVTFEEIPVDQFIVVDDGEIVPFRVVYSAVAGMGKSLADFGYHRKVEFRLSFCKGAAYFRSVVRRVVVDHDDLEQFGTEALVGEAVQCAGQIVGPVVGGDNQRKSDRGA